MTGISLSGVVRHQPQDTSLTETDPNYGEPSTPEVAPAAVSYTHLTLPTR